MKIQQTPIEIIKNVNVKVHGKVKKLKAGQKLALPLDVTALLLNGGYACPTRKMIKVINATDLRLTKGVK